MLNHETVANKLTGAPVRKALAANPSVESLATLLSGAKLRDFGIVGCP